MVGLAGKPAQRVVLISAIAANLTALFYYKYVYAIAAGLAHMGVIPGGLLLPIILPLGISFFTFTQIGFLVDCAAGTVKDRSPINYVLFVTFFPHLIAGPILHHLEIMPQFENKATYRVDFENLARGASLFAIGLFKKVVIADSLAAYVGPGFGSPYDLTVVGSWGTVLCYSLQLYFDFSGYSDMAVGIAKMFNIQFPINFNSPYKALNIIDFWQRWHMTLTRYLTLLLFNPIALALTRRRMARGLPMSRKALAKFKPFATLVAFPMFCTMGLAGIWHGAGLQFLIFGLLHASYLTINHMWRTFGPKPAPAISAQHPRAWALGCLLLTYLAVVVGQVFFRSSSSGAAVSMLAGMIGLHGFSGPVPVPHRLLAHLGEAGHWLQIHNMAKPVEAHEGARDLFWQILSMIVAYALVWFTPNSTQIVGLEPAGHPDRKQAEVRPLRFLPIAMNAGWGAAVGLIAVIALLGVGAKSEFLYFQF
jgi:D-alanyl-lipoteichoic acid acyltransferase DltB (MBOAT superfamily)